MSKYQTCHICVSFSTVIAKYEQSTWPRHVTSGAWITFYSLCQYPYFTNVFIALSLLHTFSLVKKVFILQSAGCWTVEVDYAVEMKGTLYLKYIKIKWKDLLEYRVAWADKC